MTGSAQRKAIGARPLPCVVIELGRLLERRLQRELAAVDLTTGQFMALSAISFTYRPSRADLARAIQVTPQAAGGLANQLIDKGLISRTEAAGPGAPLSFTVTDTGQDLLDRCAPHADNIRDDMLSYFRPNLASALDGAVRHLVTQMSR
jgi:DNA-binding MarR family transcriptional regulator